MASIARCVEVETEYASLVRARVQLPREDAISPATRRITETLSMNAIATYTTSGSGGRINIKAGGPLGASAASNMICIAEVLASGTEGVPGPVPFDAQAVEL